MKLPKNTSIDLLNKETLFATSTTSFVLAPMSNFGIEKSLMSATDKNRKREKNMDSAENRNVSLTN